MRPVAGIAEIDRRCGIVIDNRTGLLAGNGNGLIRIIYDHLFAKGIDKMF